MLKDDIKNMSIANKFQIVALGFVIISTAILWFIVDYGAGRNAREAARETLGVIADERLLLFHNYLHQTEKHLKNMTRDNPSIVTLAALKQNSPLTEIEILSYTENNILPRDQREKLNISNNIFSTYNITHGSQHPFITRLFRLGDYDDLIVINLQGDIIYTVKKYEDFGKNVLTDEQLKSTGLAQIFKQSLETLDSSVPLLHDFEAYPYSQTGEAAFMALSIFNNIADAQSRTPIAIGIIKIDSSLLGEIGNKVHLDTSKKIFLYNRSENKIYEATDEDFITENSDNKNGNAISAKASAEMLRNKQDEADAIMQQTSFIDTKTLSNITNFFTFLGQEYQIITVTDEETVLAPFRALQGVMIITVMVILFVMFMLTRVASATITGPIRYVTESMKKLASGDTDIKLQNDITKNEIGEMVKAVSIFQESMINTISLEKEKDDRLLQENEQSEFIKELINEFSEKMSGLLEEANNAVENMEESNQIVRQAVTEAKDFSSEIANATGNANSNVQTMASATTQMSSSISGIAENMQRSIQAIQSAHKTTQETDVIVKNMSDLSNQIGEIVSLINDIANQTNLLALNATIEAARAGEAGKGFAVVANEVKNLASQTTNATEEISSQIGNIRDISSKAVEAIISIQGEINHVSEMMTAVSASMEEQAASAQEINQAGVHASAETTLANQKVGQVNERVVDSFNQSEIMSASVNNTAKTITSLRDAIQDFLGNLKT